MWEKKSGDDSIHDKDQAYVWADAIAVLIADLNSAPCFAGHCDWRLPNIKELQGIVNYENVGPAVSPAFNTGCVGGATVVTGSCTASAFYWSSTSSADVPFSHGPSFAWGVVFNDGDTVAVEKNDDVHVRAVRGGL